MKIGILGGTFDPIHNGHLMLGEYAYNLFGLDNIWFMPNGNPPHKENSSIAVQTKGRVEMVTRAISDKPYFKLQSYEIDRAKVSYSYQTMEYFQSIYPEHEFYFIIGADSLFSIEEWKHPERLFKTCIILAAYRNKTTTAEMLNQIHYLTDKYKADIRLLNIPDIDISSSDIRRCIQSGKDIRGLLPEKVRLYIQSENLYKGN